MSDSQGLNDGARVAVVGGGISAATLASALLQHASLRGKSIEVKLYRGAEGPRSLAPVIVSPECRSRLAGLGVRIDPAQRSVDLTGVEVIARGRTEVITTPSAGVWVIDTWGQGRPGERGAEPGLAGRGAVAETITEIAGRRGAEIVERTVDRVEWHPSVTRSRSDANRSVVVRSGGHADRFDAAAMAGGANLRLGSPFFSGFSPAPTLPAVEGRLTYGRGRLLGLRTVKLILDPVPGVEGLYLIPCHGSVYALAFGAGTVPADLCQAVMAAARDGHLPAGFEMAALNPTRIPYGAGRKLTSEGQLAVGALAGGHPFQLGLSETLASCTRGAHALLAGGIAARSLNRRYVKEGIVELLDDARSGARALQWLRRAADQAPAAFAKARLSGAPVAPFSGGVLALPSPTVSALHRAARRTGFGELLRTLFQGDRTLDLHALQPEPDLYYVVDDDPDAREALVGLLEDHGATVVSFADELSLYSAVAKRPPTAILLDVVLNWVDGLSLCEGLKRHPLTRDTKVFVMSGLDRPHVRQRAMDAGAETFLPKPMRPRALLDALMAHDAWSVSSSLGGPIHEVDVGVDAPRPELEERPAHREEPASGSRPSGLGRPYLSVAQS